MCKKRKKVIAKSVEQSIITEDNSILPLEESDRPPLSNVELLTLYGQVLSQEQYEGSGIWSRFNILIGIDMSIVAAVVLLLSVTGNTESHIILVIIRMLCVVGCIFSVWSLCVLRKLWKYHKHWQNKLCEIEKLFPNGCIRPFEKDKPKSIKKKNSFFNEWVKKATQPFFIVFGLFWIGLFIFSFFLKNL